MKTGSLPIGGLLLLSAVAWGLSRQKSAPSATAQIPDGFLDIQAIDPFFSVDSVDLNSNGGWDDGDPPLDVKIDIPNLANTYNGPVAAYPSDKSIAAFLYMIRTCEHSAVDVFSGEDYNTVAGGDRFLDMTDHPYITGEWKGRKLAVKTCKNAGLSPGCISTAAGAYQITAPTWRDFRGALTDFSPPSQDAAAARILARVGATDALNRGDLAGAITLASRRWASLPGSTAGQGGRTLAFAVNSYNTAFA